MQSHFQRMVHNVNVIYTMLHMLYKLFPATSLRARLSEAASLSRQGNADGGDESDESQDGNENNDAAAEEEEEEEETEVVPAEDEEEEIQDDEAIERHVQEKKEKPSFEDRQGKGSVLGVNYGRVHAEFDSFSTL